MERPKGIKRAKQILQYSDSEPNELLIGLLHCCILPFAMFELGNPWAVVQVGAHLAGAFQLYAVLCSGNLNLRSIATKLAALVSVATVVNYTVGGLMRGSNFGWLLILVFAVWNVVRKKKEKLAKWTT